MSMCFESHIKKMGVEIRLASKEIGVYIFFWRFVSLFVVLFRMVLVISLSDISFLWYHIQFFFKYLEYVYMFWILGI